MYRWLTLSSLFLLTLFASLGAIIGQQAPDAKDGAKEEAKAKGAEAEDNDKKEGLIEDGATKDGARPLKPQLNAIFSLIPDATLSDAKGKAHQLYDFGTKRPLVLFITNASCPLSRKNAPLMVALAKDYADKIDILAINPNDSEVKEAAAAAELYGFTMPYIVDVDGEFARVLGAKSTTETFLIDTSRRLRYRGAVDDQFGIGISLEKAKNTYLRDAIDALLAKKPVPVEATSAPGCELGYDIVPVEREGAPTWYGEVEPIFQKSCQSCHREGEAGPFELMNYADAKEHAPMIRRVVRQGTMPPWFANPHVGGPFKNDASLSVLERQTILEWVEGGTLEGDKAKAIAAKKWNDGWTIPLPDSQIKVGETFTVPATGTIRYQREKVVTTEKEDKWVSAYEIRASEPIVVHHVLVFISYPRKHPRKSDEPKDFEGLTGAFAGMVPGQKATSFPEGMGKLMPKGSTLTFQIHYTAVGVKTDVDIVFGLKFTDGRPKREVRTGALSDIGFAIPPGTKDFAVTAQQRVSKPMRILGLLPHMHVRGAAFEYRATTSDGKEEVLLDVPQYDFNWQLAYQFAEPKYVASGSRITATGWYDNSADNPANPDPKKTVRFGEQTWDEMMIGYFDYYYVRDEKDVDVNNGEPESKPEQEKQEAKEEKPADGVPSKD